jgi:hypothetical protein
MWWIICGGGGGGGGGIQQYVGQAGAHVGGAQEKPHGMASLLTSGLALTHTTTAKRRNSRRAIINIEI